MRYKSSRWRKIVDKVGPKADPRPLDITFINRIMTVHTQLFFKLVAQLFFEKLRRLHCNVERYFFNHLFYQRVRSQLVSNNLICLFKSHSSIFFNFFEEEAYYRQHIHKDESQMNGQSKIYPAPSAMSRSNMTLSPSMYDQASEC